MNTKETLAFDAVKAGVEYGYQTDEITEMVSEKLGCSINTAKGYIGRLCKLGMIKKERYFDRSIGWITQFSINNETTNSDQ